MNIIFKKFIDLVIKYLFGRSAHSKLAKYSMVIGAGLLTGPIWLPFVEALVGQFFEISIDSIKPVYGVVLIFTGLVFYALVELGGLKVRSFNEIEIQNKKNERDRVIIDLIDSAITEVNAENFLNRLISDHSYLAFESENLRRISEIIDSSLTNFHNDEISSAANDYSKASKNLMTFLGYKFFAHGGVERFVLFPEGNWDRGAPNDQLEALYSKYTRELETLARIWENARSEFNRIVHASLV